MALKTKETPENFKGSNELNFLGSGTYVEGSVETKGSLRIDGRVKGAVKAGDTLTVGAKGDVSGEVNARMAVIGGRIEGDIRVEEKLVLEANSVVIGNLKAKKLVIDEGAIFQGKSDMGAQKSTKSVSSTLSYQTGGASGGDEKTAGKTE
ncbi:MAG: polymer-forming cytoskeletal protein [Calditrichaeota bacterium]|nr:polymer-forming cytoskeletal protein [Calditrichota bacterium]RQW03378.1 MAG: polymer-forming cytoskeletal protein [Calditrichota bacterium]